MNQYQQPVPPREKKSKAPYVVLFSLIGVLLVMAGIACVMIFKSEPPRPKVFSYTCEDFTGALNEAIAGDSDFDFQFSADKWVVNEDEQLMEYTDNGLDIKVKTEQASNLKSKIEKIRIGKASEGKNLRLAAASVAALQRKSDQNAVPDKAVIETRLKKLTDGTSQKEIINNSQVTYDKEKDELVIEPSADGETTTAPEESSKAGDGVAATKPENDEPEYSGFVAGNGYVSIGDALIVSDGSKISYMKNIDAEPKTIDEVSTDGRVLSDGKTVYYVQHDKGNQQEYIVLYKDIDEDKPLELMRLAYHTVLVHYYNDCLYYAVQDAESTEYQFYKYDTLEGTSELIKTVTLSPFSTVVRDNMMYFSVTPGAVGFMDKITTRSFNFDTEEVKDEIKACSVSNEGFIKGSGNPVFNSYKDDSNGNMSEHYLYTLKDGKMEKSKEITGHKTVLAASPSSDQVILSEYSYGDNTAALYLFDRATGDEEKLLEADVSSGKGFFATADLSRPDELYILYGESDGRSVIKVNDLYQVTDSGLKTCRTEDVDEIGNSMFVVADGKILDNDLKAHTITVGEAPAAQTTTTAAEKDYSAYVGTWYKELPNSASHFVVIKSIEGSTITFTVNTVFPRASRVSLSNPVTAEIVDGKVEFEYKDSFENTGSGTLELGDGYVSADVKSNQDGMGSFVEYTEKFTDHNDDTGAE